MKSSLLNHLIFLRGFLLIFITTGFVTTYAELGFAGGDLGGGGRLVDIQKDFRLDVTRLSALRQQNDLERALQVWAESLSEKEYQELMVKVFKHAIAPQIVEKK